MKKINNYTLKKEKAYQEEMILLLEYLQRRYNEIGETEDIPRIRAIERLIDEVIDG